MDKWQKIFGDTPEANPREYEQILRRVSEQKRRGKKGATLSLLLCGASIAAAVFVSIFVKPQDLTSATSSVYSIEATSSFDESFEYLSYLSE